MFINDLLVAIFQFASLTHSLVRSLSFIHSLHLNLTSNQRNRVAVEVERKRAVNKRETLTAARIIVVIIICTHTLYYFRCLFVTRSYGRARDQMNKMNIVIFVYRRFDHNYVLMYIRMHECVCEWIILLWHFHCRNLNRLLYIYLLNFCIPLVALQLTVYIFIINLIIHAAMLYIGYMCVRVCVLKLPYLNRSPPVVPSIHLEWRRTLSILMINYIFYETIDALIQCTHSSRITVHTHTHNMNTMRVIFVGYRNHLKKKKTFGTISECIGVQKNSSFKCNLLNEQN